MQIINSTEYIYILIYICKTYIYIYTPVRRKKMELGEKTEEKVMVNGW